MSFNKFLVNSLKKELNVKKDQDLAEIFNVNPFMFSSWKRSKGKLIEEVVKFGIENKLDFNAVFYSGENKKSREIPILMAENLFSYYLNPERIVASLPKYTIPVVSKSSIGFQVISQNMEPTLEVSSIVFGIEVSLEELRIQDIYVLNVVSKGIFIVRYMGYSEDGYAFENDNKSFSDFVFKKEELIATFRVNSFLSKFT